MPGSQQSGAQLLRSCRGNYPRSCHHPGASLHYRAALLLRPAFPCFQEVPRSCRIPDISFFIARRTPRRAGAAPRVHARGLVANPRGIPIKGHPHVRVCGSSGGHSCCRGNRCKGRKRRCKAENWGAAGKRALGWSETHQRSFGR